MSAAKRHFILTGPPGIGKTTVVKKVCEHLSQLDLATRGFYTEELRSDNSRTGFDVVSLDGKKRASLARVSESDVKFKVGKYAVTLKEFESVALPLLTQAPHNINEIIVIDEIGKMEMFSENFVRCVDGLFKNVNNIILATIPIPRGKPIPILQFIRNDTNTKLFEVDRSNRDDLPGQIINDITQLL